MQTTMQTCWEIITDSTLHPYTANVSFGTIVFNLHKDDFFHILDNESLIRDVITPKYQIMFYDLGNDMKSVVITLTRNLLCK